jgi:hypothetical protein
MRYRLRTLLIVLAVGPAFLLVCRGENARCSKPSTSDDVSRIVALLNAMPRWPTLPVSKTRPDYAERREQAIAAAKKIEEISSVIATFALDDIRAAYAKYDGRNHSEALEIVSRYLFAIPDKPAPGSEEERMANYRHAMPLLTDESKPGTSFPWVANEKGQLHFSVECTGFIGFGPLRNPLKAFDYYRMHFGARKLNVGKEHEVRVPRGQ